MSKLKTLVAALAFAPALALASAPTFDFYFEGGSGLFDTVSNAPGYSASGIGLTVTAKKSSGAAAQVADRWDGLGVISGGFLESSDITSGESIILTFSKSVTLTGLQFSLWDDITDDALLTVGSTTVDLGNINTSGLLTREMTFSGLTGTQFTIKGEGLLTGFRLAGVTVAAAVPEPATWALMGLGLVGLAAAARKRRAD